MPRTSTCGGPRKSTGLTPPTTFPSRTGIPATTGCRTTPTIQERTVTYYEYPSALSARQYAGTMLVDASGAQKYKTIEVAGTRRLSGSWQANVSFSATKLYAPFADRQALNPNAEINTAEDFWEITSKVSGGYTLAMGDRGVSQLRAPQRRSSGSQRPVSAAGRPSGRSSSTPNRSAASVCRRPTWWTSDSPSG